MNEEAGRDDPGRDGGLEDAWAQIVADYDREPGPVDGSGEDLPPDSEPSDGGDDAGPPFVLSLGPAGAQRPGGSEDEQPVARDEWVPPQPPPLPRPTGATGAAWVALVCGPLLLLAATFAGWELPTLLTAGCVIGFVGGLVFLIMQMDDRRDGWDDGAQV